LVTIFIADKNLNIAETLRIRNPPVYKINVQKAVEKNVAVSICGIVLNNCAGDIVVIGLRSLVLGNYFKQI